MCQHLVFKAAVGAALSKQKILALQANICSQICIWHKGKRQERLEEQKHHSPIPATGGRKELGDHKHTHNGRSKTAGLRNSVQLFAGNNRLSNKSRGIQKRNMDRREGYGF